MSLRTSLLVWLSLSVLEGGLPDLHGKGHIRKVEAAGPDQGLSEQMVNILGFSLFSWLSTHLLFRSD